jgi:hypothetical protein
MRCCVVAAIAEPPCVEVTRTGSTYSSVFRIKGYDPKAVLSVLLLIMSYSI